MWWERHTVAGRARLQQATYHVVTLGELSEFSVFFSFSYLFNGKHNNYFIRVTKDLRLEDSLALSNYYCSNHEVEEDTQVHRL
jgi:hypothetical protein